MIAPMTEDETQVVEEMLVAAAKVGQASSLSPMQGLLGLVALIMITVVEKHSKLDMRQALDLVEAGLAAGGFDMERRH